MSVEALLSPFYYLENPQPDTLPANLEEFISNAGKPICIFQSGSDPSRTRAVVTLLHGNEPSGSRAFYRWLQSGETPRVNLVTVIASVEAALFEPIYSNRVYPGKRDLNRCFGDKAVTDDRSAMARAIITLLQHYEPEAVIDIHNTSGTGPAFGVSITRDKDHEALTSLFTDRLITTDLRLGALMEISEYVCPTVTIECGGREDDSADRIAFEGLQRFLAADSVFTLPEADWGLELLNNPVRVELQADAFLTYAEQLSEEVDLTLRPDVEHFNFGVIEPDTPLGWIKEGALASVLRATNSVDHDVLDELLYLDGSQLKVKQPLKLFMITSNPDIAKMDCLFYAVKSCGNEVTLSDPSINGL